MIAIDKAKISHLEPFNSIISIKNSFTTVIPNSLGTPSGLILKNSQAMPGIYEVNVNIYSQSTVYWKASYDVNNCFKLKNGANIFKINIDKPQIIDLSIQFLYSLETDRFNIYSFSISKCEIQQPISIYNRPVVNRNYQLNRNYTIVCKNDYDKKNYKNRIRNLQVGIDVVNNRSELVKSTPLEATASPLPLKIESISTIAAPNQNPDKILPEVKVEPKAEINVESKAEPNVESKAEPDSLPDISISTCDCISKPLNGEKEMVPIKAEMKNVNHKKNILLVADTKDWCFYNTSVLIRRYLGHKYNICIECYAEAPKYREIYPDIEFDLVVRFWYGHNGEDPFGVYPNSKKAVCIYDYIYWNCNISQNLQIMLPWFLRTLKASDYVLYSCPAIRDTLIQQIKPEYFIGKIFPIYDGYDPKKFFYKEYNNNDKLLVGWAGNIKNIFKRFDYLKEAVENIEWIELKLQDRSTFIPHSEMVHYYHSVDVIVCLSDAEGTPTPVLEASASGRAWVSTDVGICGLINNVFDTKVKPGIIINDKSELLSKLRYLYENRKVMQEMGLVGWMSVNQAFTWDVQMKQFEAVFDKI